MNNSASSSVSSTKSSAAASEIPSSKRRLVLRVGLATAIGSIGLVLLLAFSQLFVEVSASGETSDVFTEAAELPPSLIDAVVWLPDNEESPRPLEPLTRTDVAATWLRAWAQIAILAETGETEGIEVYFSNSARQAILASVEDWEGSPIHQIGHELYLTFYSEDDQVIGLTATKSNLLRTEVIGGQKEYFDAEESYEAILILEDGNWRVQHWVRRSATGRWHTGSLPPAIDDAEEGLTGPTISLFDPAASDDLAVLDMRLEDVAGQGANAVRLNLESELFEDDGFVSDDQVARVNGFLDLAGKNGLSVIPSLFSGDSPRLPSRWDSDVRRLEAFVPVLAEHESVALYELADKPDLTVGDGVSAALVNAWLGHVGHAVRELDPNTPMMITWSTQGVAVDADLQADLVGFAYPTPTPDHPAIVGEIVGEESSQVIVRSAELARDLPTTSTPLTAHPLVRLAIIAVIGFGLFFAASGRWQGSSPLRVKRNRL